MMNQTGTPQTIYLKDYLLPAYNIKSVNLTFELEPSVTRVHSVLEVQGNADATQNTQALKLDGEGLKLLSIKVDGQVLAKESYLHEENGLTLLNPANEFFLETVVEIAPDKNSALEGLYLSSGNFCTQCEAEGFRRITFFLDRPDVMAKYTTKIIADKAQFPVLLSNGNCIDSGELDNGRHFKIWHDPSLKPCYLFALVAGDLILIPDTFTTMSGRDVTLEIYVEKGNEDKCDHAMQSLKKAMAWDEKTYGCEYDLDNYMIVAVNDFNMGAMENKGLNVFNSRFVLAKQQTATDIDFLGIEGVIAHEYFHNWSGNRVTCRDWFQLSLKEGFTVFRDQMFSGDMNSQAVKRIEDVRMLRTHQFAEDAGPMAHPVRPESYVEINNFYTLTVYEKGAELVRMFHTLLGEEGFRKGSDLYFERHDGQAVTCEDFVHALADANEINLDNWFGWYQQAGTPHLQITRSFDNGALNLTVKQSTPDTQGQTNKQPVPVPVRIAFFDEAGVQKRFSFNQEQRTELLLVVDQLQQTFRFEDLQHSDTPSLLRNFSAPVIVESDLTHQEIAKLMAVDSDPFNRWEASQHIAQLLILDAYDQEQQNKELMSYLSTGHKAIIVDEQLEHALKAEALTLPDILYLMEQIPAVDPVKLHHTLKWCEEQLTAKNHQLYVDVYQRLNHQGEYRLDAQAMGERALKNRLLRYLSTTDDGVEFAWQQYQRSNNMNDRMAALGALVQQRHHYQDEVIAAFYQDWQHDPLVLDKWFALQAIIADESTVERVRQLQSHKDFTLKNPNRLRSLIGAFAMRNPVAFHRQDGEGYQILKEVVIALNSTNPQIAARMVNPLIHWRRYGETRQQLMKQALSEIFETENLSKDLYEIVKRGLGE